MKGPFKLNIRKKDEKFGDVDFVFNARDLPTFGHGDVARICSVHDKNVSILLQVLRTFDDSVPKNTISIIDEVISPIFPFKRYSEVFVEKVTGADVALDLLELTFREQYISRSDMLRIRKHLLSRCVYLGGKIEFSLIRLKVNELWRKGECVSCGYVDDDTRVVFRSSSALVFVFIQMSAEMWDFDTQGVCYYEKCIDGFLPELFRRWRDCKCSHYVTVVLFSRWFYATRTAADFPESETSKIHKDYRGRFYQDFYQLLIQNEHYEDWTLTIPKLKRAFHKYNQSVSDHMTSKGMPAAENSTSGDGNVLEALNMAFNVFSNHYVDRTFERTGQVIIFITPGSGVFNVERTFANMTKQRNFDYGIAVDLVFLGEQPLHAVPLLVYHSKTTAKGNPPEIEDYFIMHWVNYSYYNPIMYPNPMSDFRPRLKLPYEMLEGEDCLMLHPPNIGCPTVAGSVSPYPDFDVYDAFVNSSVAHLKKRHHKTSVPQLSPTLRSTTLINNGCVSSGDEFLPRFRLMMSAEFSSSCTSTTIGSALRRSAENVSSCPIEIPKTPNFSSPWNNNLSRSIVQSKTLIGGSFYSPGTSNGEIGIDRLRVGSAEGKFFAKHSAHNFLEPEEIRRPLINPFKPSEFSVRITSNRRRWIHVFPVDSRGLSKQAHHSVAGTSIFYADLEEPDPTQVPEAPLVAIDSDNNSAEIVQMRHQQNSPEILSTLKEISSISSTSSCYGSVSSSKGKTLIWAWGCTGEEQWNPDIVVGTDWKSIVLPACLPITTDFFPDARSLKNDYLFSEHTILLDDSVKELWKSSTTSSSAHDFRLDVFNELIAQRLQQGFQVVLLPLDMLNSAITIGCGPTLVPEKVCYLSISRIYHRLSLVSQCIYVTKFFPRHPYPLKSFICQYECQVPDSHCFQTTTTKFEHEGFEKINWSSVDNLIVLQGEGDDYLLQKDMKFWETRFFILSSCHPATQKIASGECNECDVYTSVESPDFKPLKLLDSFIKFMEALNRIRRSPNVIRISTNVNKLNYLNLNDPLKIISAAMSAFERGFNFISGNKSSEKLFVSAELAHWLICSVRQIDTVSSAIEFCQHLLSIDKIRHVGGESKFVYGFYLYYFVQPPSLSSKDTIIEFNLGGTGFGSGNTYLEVAVTENSCTPSTSSNFCPHRFKTYKFYFDSTMKRSERFEWGEIRLNQSYCHTAAFEVNFQWLVATGAIVNDAVMQLHRKSAVSPLCLLPIPKDPFALPENPHADPLRCPIFVPLDAVCLSLLDNDDRRVTLVQKAILTRFGFVPMSCEVHAGQLQYVHLSAGMSVMLRERHGFLWSWNPTLGHRYRSQVNTGDERFQDKIFADFRAFCQNSKNRLYKFVREEFLVVRNNNNAE